MGVAWLGWFDAGRANSWDIFGAFFSFSSLGIFDFALIHTKVRTGDETDRENWVKLIFSLFSRFLLFSSWDIKRNLCGQARYFHSIFAYSHDKAWTKMWQCPISGFRNGFFSQKIYVGNESGIAFLAFQFRFCSLWMRNDKITFSPLKNVFYFLLNRETIVGRLFLNKLGLFWDTERIASISVK